MADLRSSQRVSLCCTECARRRVKCDKKVPCARCISQRRAHLCTREVVNVRGKPSVAAPGCEDLNASLARQNSRLHERVAELELALMMSLEGKAGLQGKMGLRSRGTNNLATTSSFRPQEELPKNPPLEDVGPILDNWNIGASRPGKPLNPSAEGNVQDLVSALRAVPVRHTSTQIINYSLRSLGWIHCALPVNDFSAQHEAFHQALEANDLQVLQNHQWMAIYFSLLTVGLFFMSEEESVFLDLPAEINSEGALGACHLWYASAFRQLEVADVMGKPRLCAVQVAAILSLCHSHFGESHREINLSGIAQNAARALQMHRLGTEQSFPSSLERFEEWSTESGRELGRRLWWQLVICDWLKTYRQPPRIHPEGFDCELVVGNYDHDVVLGGETVSDGTIEVSPLLHHIELAKISQLFYDYQQTPKKTSATLCELLRRLDELEAEFVGKVGRLTASFAGGVLLNEPEPLWLTGQRVHYLCSLNFIRLTICRIVLDPKLSHIPACSEIREHGLKAAFSIVEVGHIPECYQLMWIFLSAPIAAGVFLRLDLLVNRQEKPLEDIQDQRGHIEHCISSLSRYSHKTEICREGQSVLTRLLEFEKANEGRQVSQDDIYRYIVSISQSTEFQTASMEQTNSSCFMMSEPQIEQGYMLPPSDLTMVMDGMGDNFDVMDSQWFMESMMLIDSGGNNASVID